jgi:hypothetical protein
MEFVRFGGLSSVNQKGYNPSMPTMHSPPARKGVYAFPLGCIEPFLLGGSRRTAKGMARYVRDKKGNKISYKDNPDLYTNTEGRPFYAQSGAVFLAERNFYKVFSTTQGEKDEEIFWVRPAPMKRFIHVGEIWHHLGDHLSPSQILSRKGYWVFTDIESYEEAFKKESIRLRQLTAKDWVGGGRINEVRKKFGWYSKGHIEVFIPRIKSS